MSATREALGPTERGGDPKNMCGIAGIYNITSAPPVEEATLHAMIGTMPHRGPDAVGVEVFGRRGGFGHARLSILDLRPESNQPFSIDDGDLTITYNGEVFNYVELRAELEGLGHRFRTDGDTEVLLRAYKEWGPAAMRRCNGMWALAIYDRRKESLFCARDRFGVKPFNYVVHKGRFLFASEIKAILAAAPELSRPDYDSLSRVLRAAAGARCESTCFQGIKRLRPAHCATITRNEVKIERWWDFPTEIDHEISYEAATEELGRLLDSAVQVRLRSDVPVGLTLSSGLDSTAIAAVVRKHHAGSFDTFTAAYNGEPYDESTQADEFAKSLGMTSNLVAAEPESFVETLSKIVWHLEMPVHSPAVFPLWNIARAARKRVTVLLEGQGADEVLAGYRYNFLDAVIDLARAGRWTSAWQEGRHAVDTLGFRTAVMLAGRHFNPPFLHKAFRWQRGDEGVYAGPLVGASETPEVARSVSRAGGRLNASLLEQIEGGLVNLLHYGDAITMAHSLESRCPFLDYRLVEFACRLPGEFKLREGYGKKVLRDAVRSFVPPQVVNARIKLGFPTPIRRWFRERPEETVYPVLLSEPCRKRGLFNPKALEAALSRHISGRVNLEDQIFRWILTEMWFQQFIDGRAKPEPPRPSLTTAPSVLIA